MTLDELAKILANFTHEHYAKRDFQPFFRFLHQLSLRGMGVGTGTDVASSGEIQAMHFVRDALQRDCPADCWNIFDVGAGVGSFVLTALQTFGTANRRFFCFEPSDEAFGKLQTALAGHAEAAAFKVGLGDCDAVLPLYADRQGSGLASLYQRRLDHLGIPMHHLQDVTITTLDRFAEQHQLERIHFLKLDVEGNEIRCIEGARKLIDAGRINFIQFEFGGCNIDSRTYFRDFWHALKQYRIKRILRDGLYDIQAYSESDEMFLVQNYVACLAG